MATVPSFMQFWSLPRWHSDWPVFTSVNFVQVTNVRLRSTFVARTRPRRKPTEDMPDVVEADSEKKTARNRAPSRRKKKTETPEESVSSEASESAEVPKKPQRRTREKATSTSSSLDKEEPEKKVTKQGRTKKKIEDTVDQNGETELNDDNDSSDDEIELEFDLDGGEDNSRYYPWPPLVCCFGSVQQAFLPSGRRANRLVDYEAQERMKNALWIPEKFVRAPGGCASDVALALKVLGSNVAMMGKIGNDDWGKALLYHLDVNRVQTRAIKIDSRLATAVSQMKIRKRGSFRMIPSKPCAEDALKPSEINIDVLREAKMFYVNSFSLLDPKMRSTALQAIKISKKLGGLIFFDLNLPLPLWQSREETETLIEKVWDLADIIEVTKQELEFLCEIVPSEEFDTKNNNPSKFVHYSPEVISPIFHDNLKVLFVTNGTSKIHYYTKEHDGFVRGMEEPPITPFTCDMSAAGDAIVAALMSKLVVQLHLLTNKEYLEYCINYAINRGVEAQWFQARVRGYPKEEEESREEEEEEDVDVYNNDLFTGFGIKTISEKEYRMRVAKSIIMESIGKGVLRPSVPIREGMELASMAEEEDEDEYEDENIFYGPDGIKLVTEDDLMRIGSKKSSS